MLIGLHHYVVGAILLVFGVVYVFVGWPRWARWYDRRLIAAGVVIDRSEWFRRDMLAGDRQAKWLALTLVAMLVALGIGLLAVAIVIAT